MKPRPLFWRLFFSYVLIVLAALLLVMWYGNRTLRQFHRSQLDRSLEAQARLFAQSVRPRLPQDRQNELDELAKDLGRVTGTRLTVILPDGKVIADSDENIDMMENHRTRDRGEIMRALEEKEVGSSERPSGTLGEDYRYVALPLMDAQGEVTAVVRTSLPVSMVEATLARLRWHLLTGAGLAALVIFGVSGLIARRITRPIEEITIGVRRFAAGDLEHRLRVDGSQEVETLAGAMNEMAAQLHQRIDTVVRQRNEQEAVLGSMVEGVLALDSKGCIVRLNQACAEMLDLDPAAVQGRLVHEVLRKPDPLHLIDTALAGSLPVQKDLVIRGDRDRYLEAHATPMRDAAQRNVGVLVVLHDVTRLRQLENVRREFVANVSHELRTPITSIKGFVETLLDGALDDREHAERFLGIILRQSDRLNAIINDILSLARIEKEGEETVELEPGDVGDAVQSAVQTCRKLAEDKGIRLSFEGRPGHLTRLNPLLMEQAVVNLIDNAMKYSPEQSEVRVSVAEEDGHIVIAVADEGCGIDARHLPRLWERFYRVDKDRSSALGGTGLGLAIVKHIALAHGGSVSVDSRPGVGSTFRIHLPARTGGRQPS